MKTMKKSLLTVLLTLIAVLCLAIAACGGNSVKFKFVTGEGAPSVPDEKVASGEEFTLPAPPAWEGHSFEGWYLTEDFSEGPVEKHTADKNTTFYAKWETLYYVTLDADGGTLSSAGFYLKAGDDLSAAVKELTPTREGFRFGEWLNGDKALTAGEKMPAAAVTLKAHYQVGYTVEVYEQDLTDTAKYTRAEDYKGYAYADGTAFTPDYAPEGFTLAVHDGDVRSLTLDASDPAKNVFKLYFDRSTVTVYLRPNYTAGGDEVTLEGKYGEEIELPAETFTREGYLLAGWSEAADGSQPYYVAHETYNGGTPEATKYTLKATGFLYAVWQQAYTDVFGGADGIYVVGDKIYLSRAGFLFSGKQIGSSNVYTFSNGEFDLDCRVYDNGTFCYADPSHGNFTGALYTPEGDIVKSQTIYFTDNYNSISYASTNEQGISTTSRGTYSVDDYGYYTAHFTEGNMVGHDFVFIIGTAADEEGRVQQVFALRNDREYGLGKLTMYYYNGAGYTAFTEDYGLTLDGFGYAELDYQGSVQVFFYAFDNESLPNREVLVLYTSEGSLFGTFVVDTFNGTNGYVIFDVNTYGTFTETDGTGVLTLDGMAGAVFSKGSTYVKGYYEQMDTTLGETLIKIESGSDRYVFSLRAGNDAGEGTYVQYDAGYGEYLNLTSDGSSTMLLVAGKVKDTFALYVSDLFGMNLYRVAEGTLTEEDGVYSATVTTRNTSAQVADVGFDLSKLATFRFTVENVDLGDGEEKIMNWIAYTLEDDDTAYGAEVYTLKGGTDKLTVTGGFATYEYEENDRPASSYGVFIRELGWYYLSTVDGDLFYFSLDEDTHTFTLLDDELIGRVYEMKDDGTADRYSYLTLDGLGGAVYTTTAAGTDGNPATTATEGTAAPKTKDGKPVLSLSELPVYTFKEAEGDLTFDFILVDTYFAKANEQYAGTFTGSFVEDGHTVNMTLELDGFIFYATYSEGTDSVSGIYYVFEGDTICFLIPDGEGNIAAIAYFDIDRKEGTFTMRGGEFSECLVIDNQELREQIYAFDGYGKLTIYEPERDDEGNVTGRKEVAEGEYELLEDGTIGVSYHYLDAPNKLVEEIGVMDLVYFSADDDPYVAFFVAISEVAEVYIDPSDWSVLILDAYGSAVRYGTQGAVETGIYIVITDKLFYFVNDEATDAGVYEYSTAKGEAAAVQFDETGYFTEGLDSLLFTGYGFVVYHDATLCYYYQEASGDVTFYYAAADLTAEELEGKTVNDYGYVAVTDFGKFESEIEFEGKTYFKNDGLAITFKRATANAEQYPVPVGVDDDDNIIKQPLRDLTFTPSSGADGNFTVNALALVNYQEVDQQISCRVQRIVEGDTAVFYLIIEAQGTAYFRMDLELTYGGAAGSTYAITAMNTVDSVIAYQYLRDYLILAQLGMEEEFPNDYGTILLMTEYSAAGDPVSEYIEAEFGASSAYYDTQGNLITKIERAEPTQRTADDGEGGTFVYYTIEFTADDGLTYNLYFQIESLQGLSYYYVLALTREQEFRNIPVTTTFGDDRLDVVTEAVIASDSTSYRAGTLFDFEITYGEEGVSADLMGYISENMALLFEPADEFYSIPDYDTIVYVLYAELGESTQSGVVPLYSNLTLTSYEPTYYETADETMQVLFVQEEAIAGIFLFGDDGAISDVLIIKDTETVGENKFEATAVDGTVYIVEKIDNVTCTVTPKQEQQPTQP